MNSADNYDKRQQLGEILVVPYEIGDDEQYIFKTLKNIFLDLSERVYKYIDMEHSLQIVP